MSDFSELSRGALSITYIAHVKNSDCKEQQTVLTHLKETGALAESFAAKVGMSNAGLLLGLLHDFGKYSEKFRRYILSATNVLDQDHDEYTDAKSQKGKIDHSSAGAQYLWKHLGKTDNEGAGELLGHILATCIASHHCGLINSLPSTDKSGFVHRMRKEDDKTNYLECIENADPELLRKVKNTLTPENITELFAQLQNVVETPLATNAVASKIDIFKLGVLTRFLFSCLIDADRINSAEFEYPSRKHERLELQNWFNWSIAINRLESKFKEFNEHTGWVNEQRRSVADCCKARAADEQGIYKFTGPTGIGKTLASLRFALHHAATHKLDRIIYVIPYTTIIEQNAQEVRKIVERNEDPHSIVLEHHSNLDPEHQTWKSKTLSENWGSPIVFITMVQFLDALFSGGTRSVRRMHQMANSVLIFDEIQSLPVNCVYLFNNTINFLRKNAGTTALLCTATQPVLDKLPLPEMGQLQMAPNPELVTNKSELFERLRRVMIRNRLENKLTQAEIQSLAIERQKQHVSCLVITNTKEWASKLYQSTVEEIGSEGVYHLSTNQCPAHRVVILDAIRIRLKEGMPTICYCTALIEAGVDISFGHVIRFLTGLDSIAQAAGRCNRNGERVDVDGSRQYGELEVIRPDSENINKLESIKVGQLVAGRLFDLHLENDMLNPEVMDDYFKDYFNRSKVDSFYPIKASDSFPRDDYLTDLLSNNPSCPGSERLLCTRAARGKYTLLPQSFKDAGNQFKAIDSPTRGVIVQYGDGLALIKTLCETDPSVDATAFFKAKKEAQRYTVNIFAHMWNELQQRNAIYETQEGNGIFFLDEQHYDADLGLSLEPVTPLTIQIH